MKAIFLKSFSWTELLKNKKQFLIHFLIWTMLTLVAVTFLYSEGRKIIAVAVYKNVFLLLVFYINYSLLVPHLLLRKKRVLYLIFTFILLIISCVIIYYVFPFKVNRNLILNKPPRFIPIIFFNAFFLIISTGIRVYEQWVIYERIQKEIEDQKNKAELEVLKNQLNPHFLFNTLNSIYSLTVKKSNDAPEAIIMLSEMMRYMLYKANDNRVLLKDELEFIENYIKLQRIRIAKNENVVFNIRGAISKQKISPLLFISYIENAFKYGTDFRGNTNVSIALSVKADALQFKCINLIGSRNIDEGNSGIGMQNSKERLQLLYPENHWLTTTDKDNKFIVDLKLKLE
jgi:two-component system LytT family sensor kinase